MNDVDVFIAFYTCKEGSKMHRHLLERCIESVRREDVRNIYVIDGSRSAWLKEGEFDIELIRNENHALPFAINIAIETARDDFFLISTGSILGAGTVNNMVVEKREIEKEYGKPAAIVGRSAIFPTDNKLLLELPMAGTVEATKRELKANDFWYTNEGIAMADDPRMDWSEKALMDDLRVRRIGRHSAFSARCLATGCLVNKDRFFEIGGCDERAPCVDYDTGMRWLAFGRPLMVSDTATIHHVCGTANTFCKVSELDLLGTFCHYCGLDLKSTTATRCPVCEKDFNFTDRGHRIPPGPPASWRAWMKYEKPLIKLFQHHSYAKVLKDNPSLYRDWLKPVYREEYDRLREKPFFMGRE